MAAKKVKAKGKSKTASKHKTGLQKTKAKVAAALQGKAAPLKGAYGAVEKELRSTSQPTMFGSFDEANKSKLVDYEGIRKYFDSLVLTCKNCDKRFDHRVDLSPIEYRVNCPECNEVHILRFQPTPLLFKIISDSVDIMESDE